MPLHPWSQGPGQERAAMMTQFPKWPRGGARAAFWGPMDPGGPRTAVLARPPLGPVAGCGQRLGSLELGADGGWCGVSASPKGPLCCVLSKRSGLMSATCGTNLQGNSAAKPATFQGRQDPCRPQGVRGSPVWETRSLLMLALLKLWSHGVGRVSSPALGSKYNLIQGSIGMVHKLPSIQAIL